MIVDKELAIEGEWLVMKRRRVGVPTDGEGETERDWLVEGCTRPAKERPRDACETEGAMYADKLKCEWLPDLLS